MSKHCAITYAPFSRRLTHIALLPIIILQEVSMVTSSNSGQALAEDKSERGAGDGESTRLSASTGSSLALAVR